MILGCRPLLGPQGPLLSPGLPPLAAHRGDACGPLLGAEFYRPVMRRAAHSRSRGVRVFPGRVFFWVFPPVSGRWLSVKAR
eukprot:73186-Pyramimonas_sp.AAC.1